MEQLIHNIEDSTSVEQWEKILESEVPLKIKKTSIIKNKIKRVEKELDAIQKKKQETEKSIAKLEQKITEKNIQAISEDDIKNILEGTADQAVPISAEELYGKSLSAAIKKSPCDWLKLPESDALVIRPNNKKELSRFILVDGENQSPKKKMREHVLFFTINFARTDTDRVGNHVCRYAWKTWFSTRWPSTCKKICGTNLQ